MLIRPKDYVETKEGLFFAVLSDVIEQDRVLTFLRYQKNSSDLQKLETESASWLINNQYPHYLYHSEYADIELHGIPIEEIKQVYYPENAVDSLLGLENPDMKQRDAIHFVSLVMNSGIEKNKIGITGSLMLGCYTEKSDIDAIIYSRNVFIKVRELIKQKLQTGELKNLNESYWRDTWQRRDCELDFDEYYQYEIKKNNKCISGTSKVDISMIPSSQEKYPEKGLYKKTGRQTVTGKVIDDTYTFDYPARYFIESDDLDEVLAYTATYIGQAKQGDMISACGFVEQSDSGHKRLVVGTNREAKGEYIKIVNNG